MLRKLTGSGLRRQTLTLTTSISCPQGPALRQSGVGAVLERAKQEPSAAAQSSRRDPCVGYIARWTRGLEYVIPSPECPRSIGDTILEDCSHARRRFSAAVEERPLDHAPSDKGPYSEGLQRYLAISRICEIIEAYQWEGETEKFLEDLKATLTPDMVVRVIRAVSSPSSSLSFFRWLNRTGYQQDVSTFQAMLDVLGKGGCTNDMKLLLGNMRDAGVKPDGTLYDTLIHWFVRHDDGMTALSLSEKMKEEGLEWSVATYNSVLDLYVKEGQYEKAVTTFFQMIENSVIPNSGTLSHLIHYLLDAGKLEFAQKIYSMLPMLKIPPSPSMFALLMSAFAKMGDVRMLKTLGKELREAIHCPGEVFIIAYQSLQKEGKVMEADSFAHEVWPDLTIQERNAKMKPVDNLSISNVKYEGEALEQFEHLQCTERKTRVAVVEVVRLLEKEGLSVLEQVKVDWTADAVFKISRHLKDPALGWEIFKWFRASSCYTPDRRIDVSVLHMLAKSYNFPAFRDFFMNLQSSSTFSLEMFNSLIKEWACAKNASAAMWVYTRIQESNLKPDEETFSLLVHAYAKGRNPDKASDLCFVMQDVGLKPDVETYTAVIHSLGLAGRSDDAWSFYQRMCTVGLKPTASTYTALLNAMNMAGNTALGIKIFQEMVANGVYPTEASHGIMARIWEESGDSTEAEKLEIERKFLGAKRREDLSQKIYEVLLEGLVEQERLPSLSSFG